MLHNSEGIGWTQKAGNGTKEERAKGEWWLQDMFETKGCVWHTSPSVDPSENVTIMNLKPKTGYNVRVQLSRPGEGGEGTWGPSTLMTTDCPGEKPRYSPSCSPGAHCDGLSEYVLVHTPRPLGGCPNLAHWGLLSHLVPSVHWLVLTPPDLWSQSLHCNRG